MKAESHTYLTPCGLEVSRLQETVTYEDATEKLTDALDCHEGVLLCSSFEYPGRYTRWDVGFVRPPLKITGRERQLTFEALNSRGDILLAALAPVIKNCQALASIEEKEGKLLCELKPARDIVFEEERSRQHSFFSVIRDLIAALHDDREIHLGLYGAFGYDLTFQFEAVEEKQSREPAHRNLVLYLPDELLVVDHQRQEALQLRYEFSVNDQSTLGKTRAGKHTEYRRQRKLFFDCDHKAGEYADTVRKALDYFVRGDLFETVPGQVFTETCNDKPSVVFRRLKQSNPAPYGALMNLGEEEYLVSASPEMYVRVRNGRVETCPISGTIKRGSNAIEDAEQVRTLLNSEKDLAELNMCTDVDRNDKSRVCLPGSVKVIGRRQIEMYSRLIHTVDHVEGRLRPDMDALDAFLTHTWAVTVTGAPKHAAMQFIEDHEKSPRRWYGGAMGFIGFDGNMNTGLTLRTIRMEAGIAEVRAGATLLSDSDPKAEEAETRLKASALLAAIRGTPVPEQSQERAASKGVGAGISVLMVDHRDSFVHNLAAYFQAEGAAVKTVRPEHVSQVLAQLQPSLVVLSPGPGRPNDFRLKETIDLVLKADIPLFGVCLGLQGIVEYFGGSLRQMPAPVHGKSSAICDLQGSLFSNLRSPLEVGRYHSLVAEAIPDCLNITAKTKEGVVMAVEHASLPVSAVQFHPESIMSMKQDGGARLIRNVLGNL